MVLVSVIIPTYNRSDMLPQAIESVLKQTLTDLELIIVDDDSDDDTKIVVNEYSDPRIEYIQHSENRGGSAARNTGIEHADGKYIAFLDSDDEWMSQKLEEQVDCLESKTDEWAVAYCGSRSIRHGSTRFIRKAIGKFVSADPKNTQGKEGGEELIGNLLMMDLRHGGSSTILAKAEAIEEINGFDSTFQRQQDSEFLIRLLKRKKMAYIDKDLVITHETGYPPADSLKQSKKKFLLKFKSEMCDIEQDSHKVCNAHSFELSRVYFRELKIQKGISHLPSDELSFHRYIQLAREILEGTVSLITDNTITIDETTYGD